MSNLITLSNIDLSFENKKVLDSISLSLSKGKITTLIGPNGAGKSSLVKVILGLLKPDAGEISRATGIKIGYVPQKLRLNESLPLNVDRFLNLAGKYSKEQCIQALQWVAAEHLQFANLHTLSGGETQRVLIARALLHRPNLLVLDEPAQGVDVQGQIDLYALIDQLRHQFNCAVLMVSHDIHLVMAKTDHVICLQHHICCQGAPSSIVSHPAYVDMFGSTSHNALAYYQHNHNHQHSLSGETIVN